MATPRLLHRGYLAMGYPVVGNGFTAWPDDSNHPALHALTGSATARLPRGVDPRSVTAANGDLLAYRVPGGRRTMLVSARVATG